MEEIDYSEVITELPPKGQYFLVCTALIFTGTHDTTDPHGKVVGKARRVKTRHELHKRDGVVLNSADEPFVKWSDFSESFKPRSNLGKLYIASLGADWGEKFRNPQTGKVATTCLLGSVCKASVDYEINKMTSETKTVWSQYTSLDPRDDKGLVFEPVDKQIFYAVYPSGAVRAGDPSYHSGYGPDILKGEVDDWVIRKIKSAYEIREHFDESEWKDMYQERERERDKSKSPF